MSEKDTEKDPREEFFEAYAKMMKPFGVTPVSAQIGDWEWKQGSEEDQPRGQGADE